MATAHSLAVDPATRSPQARGEHGCEASIVLGQGDVPAHRLRRRYCCVEGDHTVHRVDLRGKRSTFWTDFT